MMQQCMPMSMAIESGHDFKCTGPKGKVAFDADVLASMATT